MTRKKNAKQTPSTGSESALLDALRSNLSLLGELAVRYEVATRPKGPEEPPSIGSPHDVYSLLGPEMSALAQEQLRVLLLDTKNNVIGQRVIYQGNVSSSQVPDGGGVQARHHRGRSRRHHQPQSPVSGDPDPSPDDVMITRKLKQAAELLDIDLLDHVVIGRNRHVSLKDRGLMS